MRNYSTISIRTVKTSSKNSDIRRRQRAEIIANNTHLSRSAVTLILLHNGLGIFTHAGSVANQKLLDANSTQVARLRERIAFLKTAIFQGEALDWYFGVDPSIQQNWDSLKEAFIYQHANGTEPTLAAYNELKIYKQNNEAINVAAESERSLLRSNENLYMDPIKPNNELMETQNAQAYGNARYQRGRNNPDKHRTCYECGKKGHIKKN
ncbi:hypothetical protein [Parasitella parasitica]|uniref:CCHC-type domain-containing protein n=1 Tax=Parasitella parasitica TaxID=35722 RepID=A0A0B7N6A1_9FUNG|nr:hypothetical protein [Parasitella parasitica]